MTFPSRLRSLRKAHHLTQPELAEYLHYSPNAVRNWELGRSTPNIATAAELAHFYGVSLDWLVGLSDKKRPTE